MDDNVVLYYYSALHNEFDALEFGHVGDWVSGDGNDIRVIAHLSSATAISTARLSR